jgi:hypothetical protein
MILNLNQILERTPLEILDGFDGEVDVLFSDNVSVRMNAMEIVISRYLWQLSLDFGNRVINSDGAISIYYNNGTFNGKSISGSLNAQIKFLMQRELSTGMNKKFTVRLGRSILSIIDKIHNELSYKLTHYVGSFDMNDMLDIQLDDAIINGIIKTKKEVNEENISLTYDKIKDYMIRNRKSGIAMMYFTGALKPAQVNTLIGPRGNMTDLDGKPYNDTITNSHFMGLNKLSWYFQEARTAAKAAIASKKAIQESERTSKNVQIIGAVMSSIRFRDCGSTNYDNAMIYTESDLLNSLGKFYMDEDGREKHVVKTDTHLIGKPIKFRHIGGCKEKNPHQTCIKCFGLLGVNLGPQVNIGHLSKAVVGKFLTQSHLSAKHHMSSSFGGTGLILDDSVSNWFNSKGDGEMFFIKQTSAKFRNYIIFQSEDVHILTNSLELIQNVDASKTSSVSTIRIDQEKDGIRVKDVLSIENDGRNMYLTLQFILYAHDNMVVKEKEIHVCLKKWKMTMPIFAVIKQEYNFSTVTKNLKHITVNAKSDRLGNNFKDLPQFVSRLNSVINDRMSVNRSWLESFAYGFAKHKDNGQLQRGLEDYVIDSDAVLTYRSFSAASSHDNFTKKIKNTKLFLMNEYGPVSHPADFLFRNKYPRKSLKL